MSKKSSMLIKDIEQILVEEKEIVKKIKDMGKQITEDYAGKDLLLVSLLKGSVIFLADLVRAVDLPLEYAFLTITNYSRGAKPLIRPKVGERSLDDIEGRDVVLVEDILDTGNTIAYTQQWIAKKNPTSLETAVFCYKKKKRTNEINEPKYVGFYTPDRFVVGYGLDYAEKYRNLPLIGVLRDVQ
jgi:hypoxanthine phosphoribosyltransferase